LGVTPRRRSHRVLAAAAASALSAIVLAAPAGAARQTPTPTTTVPATTTTVAPTTTVLPTTPTTRLSTPTTVVAPDEGRFTVAPRSGNPGTTIRISNVVPRCPTPPNKTVLVAIGMGSGRAYGSHIIATASTAADGSWGGTVTVPDNLPSGTYEMYASCFVQHPGQYDDEHLLPYSGPTFTVTNSTVTTNTSSTAIDGETASKKSDRNPWLALGIVVAVVLGLAAIIYAFIMRSRLSHGGARKT
jgi:hypothetical protein